MKRLWSSQVRLDLKKKTIEDARTIIERLLETALHLEAVTTSEEEEEE